MKCTACGKKLSVWDYLIPWRVVYVIEVTHNGKVQSRELVCKKCYESYKLLVELIGDDTVEEM